MDTSTISLLQPVDDGLPMRRSGKWTKKKVDILTRYIVTSTTAMKNKWRRRIYIDLQAGPGKNYLPTNREVFLGSPLLALVQGAGFTDYWFVEQNKQYAAALHRRCQGKSYEYLIRILTEDCNVAVDQIVREVGRIGNTLSLVFLDPEGLELRWDTVLKLASLRADIIINFSIMGLRRYADQALTLPPQTRADRFFGTTAWRGIPRNPDGTMPGHQWIEFYQERLRVLGYSWGTAESFKNRRQGELYRLLFASKHDLGIKLWEDARKNAPTQRALF